MTSAGWSVRLTNACGRPEGMNTKPPRSRVCSSSPTRTLNLPESTWRVSSWRWCTCSGGAARGGGPARAAVGGDLDDEIVEGAAGVVAGDLEDEVAAGAGLEPEPLVGCEERSEEHRSELQ